MSSVTVCASPAAVSSAGERPFLAPIFTDNMVLQRDRENPVWGWTDPGATVTVRFADYSTTTVAAADGRWSVVLPPLPAGGPHTLDVDGAEVVHLVNILIGDVWICSGQSNMEMGLTMVDNADAEVATADHPDIRLLVVERAWAPEPVHTVKPASRWKVCTPQTVTEQGWGGFSAVGYFFGRELQKEVGVPIGLIDTSWGGSAAEAWVTAGTLKTFPAFADVDERVTVMDGLAGRIPADAERYADSHDMAGAGSEAAAFDDSGWERVALPGSWVQGGTLAGYVGIVWFRKEFELDNVADARLHLGKISETDTVWVNGVKVGIGAGRDNPRSYPVPASALRPGRNVVAVRAINTDGWTGGILGSPGDLRLDLLGGASVPLDGAWRYRATTAAPTSGPDRPPLDETWQSMAIPSSLYNGMIAPLVPLGIAGAIWYQGETNVGRAEQYQELLPAMIRDWRAAWNQGDFPLYIVALTNYIDGPEIPGQSKWAELREAQAIVGRKVANSGSVVTVDIGDPHDIHPKNKQDVGRRLALVALAQHYGRDVIYSGPVYRSMAVEGDRMRVSFDHAGGLTAQGDPLAGFEIAGDDHRFAPADAVIDGETVIVSSASVPSPVAVHYGWANAPTCNLYNGDGLPAVPFRTEGD